MIDNPLAHSSSWLYGRTDASQRTRSAAEGDLTNKSRVRRLPYRIVRLSDGADMVGWSAGWDVKQKMRRWLLAMGDPEQKRFAIHCSM